MSCRALPLPQSSRNERFAKALYPKRVPRVRIPASPVFSLGSEVRAMLSPFRVILAPGPKRSRQKFPPPTPISPLRDLRALRAMLSPFRVILAPEPRRYRLEFRPPAAGR